VGLINVTDATFGTVVLKNKVPVLVDFWAEWCGPCRPVAKTLEELAEEFGDRVLIVKINSDENPETTRDYRVMSMPTLLFFSGGELVNTIVGAKPKSTLRAALENSFGGYVNR
jgi:thioredoxin 1